MLFRYKFYSDGFGGYNIWIEKKKSSKSWFWWYFNNVSLNQVCLTVSDSFKRYYIREEYKAALDVINSYGSLDNLIYEYLYTVIKEDKRYEMSEDNKAREVLDTLANGKWSQVIEINIEEISNE
jgi:hypothetical protein